MSANFNYKSPISLKQRRNRIIRLFRWLLLDITVEKAQRTVLGKKWVEQRTVARNRRRAIRFRETAIELGGVLIKLGQYLSARFDLLPDEWIEELSKLQDAVPSVDFGELQPIIEKDFDAPLSELFQKIDSKPLASASLGQVHEAWLPDGRHVAVKVRRPRIEIIIEADLEALNRVIDFLSRRTDLGKLADLRGIAREFNVTLRRELDYVEEANNAEAIKQNLKDLKRVYVPEVIRERSSKRVLTTEFIDGIKVTNFAALEAAGIDRYLTARVLANAYLNQILIDGHFHADPHPGNLLVRNNGSGVELVFLDFGMVGVIEPKMKAGLRKLVFAAVNRNVDGIVNALNDLGFIKKPEDEDKVRVAVSFVVDKFIGINLGQLKEMNFRKAFEEVNYIVYSQPIYLPADFSFLSRALETLIGLCTNLSPQLDFIEEAKPFLKRAVLDDSSKSNTGSVKPEPENSASSDSSGFLEYIFNPVFLEQVRSTVTQIVTLPRDLSNTLERLERGRVQVQFESKELKQIVERMEQESRRTQGFMVGMSALLSAILLWWGARNFGTKRQ
ncbi:MAG: AarF/ABC1/UbiB kinase family protein [Chloroflexi bacterium]|uniref:AarF/ABC1/UbiB kinase family protein n=1 Tax=Candidatus Chlorohelix allophototropha TaxID=3003348 RepID=A0A8T7M4Z9_9CHLR|nr:AarF/ABC1/UbiB kinase family protein [Chloroflexota bacterium]WJW69050.1 AarF/UbiB family protein [Chloroflexota bacterium L227-S17]